MTDYQVAGMDEVGRGGWAGPLVVCALSFARGQQDFNDLPWSGDSKSITPARRRQLANIIKQRASFVNFGIANAQEIDQLGLSEALKLAYGRAANGLNDRTKIIIDGNINYLPGVNNVRCLIGADASVPEVSAASIVAKVARDDAMKYLAQRFDKYGFERNVGYGTRLHAVRLRMHGPCEMHRRSFKPVGEYYL